MPKKTKKTLYLILISACLLTGIFTVKIAAYYQLALSSAPERIETGDYSFNIKTSKKSSFYTLKLKDFMPEGVKIENNVIILENNEYYGKSVCILNNGQPEFITLEETETAIPEGASVYIEDDSGEDFSFFDEEIQTLDDVRSAYVHIAKGIYTGPVTVMFEREGNIDFQITNSFFEEQSDSFTVFQATETDPVFLKEDIDILITSSSAYGVVYEAEEAIAVESDGQISVLEQDAAGTYRELVGDNVKKYGDTVLTVSEDLRCFINGEEIERESVVLYDHGIFVFAEVNDEH